VDIVALFCDLDDFYQAFAPAWQKHLLPAPGRHRRRPCRLSTSEIMTLAVAFQTSPCRTFKHFYLAEVCRHWRTEFPHLVSYQRLIECLPSVLVPLAAYLQTRLGTTHGIAFIDSLPLPVCHNRRIGSHRVFAGVAQRARSSMDWFYGLKLHFVINEKGELLAFRLTPGPGRYTLGQTVRGSRLSQPGTMRAATANRGTTDHQAQAPDEEQADAAPGQAFVTETSAHRERRRAAQTRVPNRPHPPPQPS